MVHVKLSTPERLLVYSGLAGAAIVLVKEISLLVPADQDVVPEITEPPKAA